MIHIITFGTSSLKPNRLHLSKNELSGAKNSNQKFEPVLWRLWYVAALLLLWEDKKFKVGMHDYNPFVL